LGCEFRLVQATGGMGHLAQESRVAGIFRRGRKGHQAPVNLQPLPSFHRPPKPMEPPSQPWAEHRPAHLPAKIRRPIRNMPSPPLGASLAKGIQAHDAGKT
jgi:hypothetical protein